eukprot:Amastigsp_a508607_23.p6 type:complete len:103 gc:universal Amastigsp_a508607_23:842-1150(+)
MRAVPIESRILNASPQRMMPVMFGVPPSSRASGSCRYICPSLLTKSTVPPPGAALCVDENSLRLATRSPGAPGPPGNLCGDTKTASGALSGSPPSGFMSICT